MGTHRSGAPVPRLDELLDPGVADPRHRELGGREESVQEDQPDGNRNRQGVQQHPAAGTPLRWHGRGCSTTEQRRPWTLHDTEAEPGYARLNGGARSRPGGGEHAGRMMVWTVGVAVLALAVTAGAAHEAGELDRNGLNEAAKENKALARYLTL